MTEITGLLLSTSLYLVVRWTPAEGRAASREEKSRGCRRADSTAGDATEGGQTRDGCEEREER